MQKKPNESFIDQYKLGFSQKVAEEFFQENDHITGQDILSVTASKQINFFVLKILFAKWQEEMKRLESPYFDFKDADVRKELISFMNTVSKKISMDQDHFQELLQEGVGQTLHLLVDPSGFLKEEFSGKENLVLTDKNAKNFLKYIKVFKEEITDLFTDHTDSATGTMLEASVAYFESLNLDDAILTELQLISEVRPVAFVDLFESQAVEEESDDFGFTTDEVEEEEPVAEVEEEIEEDLPEEEEPEAEDEWEEEKEEAFEPEEEVEESEIETSEYEEEEPEEELEDVEDEIEGVEEDDFEEEQEPEPEEVEEEIEQPDAPEEDEIEEEEPSKSLNEKLNTETSKTVNDSFEQEEKVSLADSHAQSKVSSIMQAISVNSRYMFVKELFDDEREVFEEAIEMIEGCESFDDAVELLVQDYAKTYEWDMNSDVVKELLKVVFRKFR